MRANNHLLVLRYEPGRAGVEPHRQKPMLFGRFPLGNAAYDYCDRFGGMRFYGRFTFTIFRTVHCLDVRTSTCGSGRRQSVS
jgi:hypothetical protein